MYNETAVLPFRKLCDILTNDPLYSRDDLIKEIIEVEWSKLKHPRIAGFFEEYRSQVKMAILISKKRTLDIPLKYMSTTWALYDDPKCIEALAEERRMRWEALAEVRVKIIIIQQFFEKYFLPFPVFLSLDSPINTEKVIGSLVGMLPEGAELPVSLLEVQGAMEKLLNASAPIAGIQNQPAIKIPNIPVQPDQTGTPISSNEKKNVIAIYNAELEKLYSRDYPLWQQVHCYFEAYANGTSNKDLVEIVSKRKDKVVSERTIIRWIRNGEEFAVHDPAGPKLPPLAKPIQRRK